MSKHQAPSPRFRGAIWIAVTAILVLLPAYTFTELTVMKPSGHPVVVDQVDVPGDPPPAALVRRLKATPADTQLPPVIITYHDISEQGSEFSVTPEAFASQMRLLEEGGWHTLTADEFADWLRGAPVPKHSVLVTFDDGARGVWRYAEPVFRRYDQHGIAFIITGFVGTHMPYYMTWPELALLRKSGHWDLGAHTYLGHTQIPVDSKGTLEPFLSARMWLPKKHRVETLAEFSKRTRSDLQRCIDDLVRHGSRRPRFLAFPFSARGTDKVYDALHATVDDLFEASFLDSDAGAPSRLNEVRRREFRRVDIKRNTASDRFVDLVANSMQRPVERISAGSWRNEVWKSTSGRVVSMPSTGPVRLTTEFTDNPYANLHLDPDHTTFWTHYKAKALLGGLHGDVGASLHALLHSPDQIQVVVNHSSYSIIKGEGDASRTVGAGDLALPRDRHLVSLAVEEGSVGVAIDGTSVATVKTSRASRGGLTVGGDPEEKTRAAVLDSISVAPLRGAPSQ